MIQIRAGGEKAPRIEREMRLIFFAILLGYLLVVPACAQQQYVDQKNGFSLSVPAGWSADSDGAMPAGVVLVLRREGLETAVMSLPGTTLPQLCQALSRQFKSKGARLDEERSITLQEVPGRISAWHRGSTTILSTVLVSGDRGYVLAAEIPKSDESGVQEYRQILDSFRVVRPGSQPPSRPVTGTVPAQGTENNDGGFGTDF